MKKSTMSLTKPQLRALLTALEWACVHRSCDNYHGMMFDRLEQKILEALEYWK